jgi:glycogen debranching enzyme
MTYYGSADATPLFVRLVASHCRLHGPSLPDQGVVRKDGRATTVLDYTLAALGWITRRMDESPLGLVEFRRRDPDGIPFQAWKDSTTSYLRRGGTIANWDAPIAALEVQGYTYDALTVAAGLLGERHPARAAEWRERARGLCDRTLDSCWMPADRYFAMGLDRDVEGRPRQVDSVASNSALVLDTSMLDEVEDADRYVSGMVERICSAEFLTEAGVRCRSLVEDGSMDFQDYHGT